MANIPHISSCAAVNLALSLRSDLKKRSDAAIARLKEAGCMGVCQTINSQFASLRRIAITMSLGSCLRLLLDGAWLNVYERDARGHSTAEESSQSAASSLSLGTHSEYKGKWQARRNHVESLLGFGSDVHYASLSFGGAPEARYGRGECCVMFDLKYWEPRATCFSGDTLRANFDAEGNPVPDDEILASYAIAADWWDLTVLQHEGFMSSLNLVDPVEVRAVLEGPNRMIEVHLHGPVAATHITQVLYSRAFQAQCKADIREWERRGRPNIESLLNAPRFLKLHEVLADYGITPSIGEFK